jgi:hypothetical protein
MKPAATVSAERMEEIRAEHRATPFYAPWDDAASCIASLRRELGQKREEIATLRGRLSKQWSEGYDAGVRAAKAGTP